MYNLDYAAPIIREYIHTDPGQLTTAQATVLGSFFSKSETPEISVKSLSLDDITGCLSNIVNPVQIEAFNIEMDEAIRSSSSIVDSAMIAIDAANQASEAATANMVAKSSGMIRPSFFSRNNVIVGTTTLAGAAIGYYCTKDEELPVNVLGTVAGAGLGYLAGKAIVACL